MATVYSHPESLDPAPETVFTDGRYDHEATRAAEDEWNTRLAQWCKSQRCGKGDLVGKLVYLPWADGAACYMIAGHKPVVLIHIPHGDAWDVPDYQMRGLRISDLRRMACDIGA